MSPLKFESLNLTNMPTTASSLFSAYASFTAFIMLVRSMADQLIPHQLRSYIYSAFSHLFTPHSSNLTLIVDKSCGMAQNELYEAAEIYLRTKISPLNDRLRVRKTPRQKNIRVTIDKGEEIKDSFDGITINWCFVCSGQDEKKPEKHQFELTVHKKHRVKVIESYLPYVLDRAKAIKEEDKVVKLYSRDRSYDPYDDDSNSDWSSINLEHPATFETIAMDLELKRTIMEDLDRFLRRREFYKKVGKAWKRGYLLYGPPGTGKSSLIAAMANYLKFDIYDVELTSIYDNSELRRILLSTTNRSILVIEDIDCSVEIQNREMQNRACEEEDDQPSNTKVTLSGLLNFIDGLWSSCGDERIIVFTTNHKHKIDPALLRPGRMDLHIHMSYCTPSGFRILASNYLGMHESDPHRLCGEIEELIESTKVTPAEIAGELMKSEDADVALEGLVDFLKRKKEESNKIENEGTDESEIQETDQDADT